MSAPAAQGAEREPPQSPPWGLRAAWNAWAAGNLPPGPGAGKGSRRAVQTEPVAFYAWVIRSNSMMRLQQPVGASRRPGIPLRTPETTEVGVCTWWGLCQPGITGMPSGATGLPP